MEYKLPPAFFKFFVPKSSSQSMRLPYTEEVYPQNVIVRDKRGNEWNLKLERGHESYFFTEGWVKFKDDNSLEEGDCLVFYYASEGLFNVRIHDLTACEKNLSNVPVLNPSENNQAIAPGLNASEGNQVSIRDLSAFEKTLNIAPNLNPSQNNQAIAPSLKASEGSNHGINLGYNAREKNKGIATDHNACKNNQVIASPLAASKDNQVIGHGPNSCKNNSHSTKCIDGGSENVRGVGFDLNAPEDDQSMNIDLNVCEKNQGVPFDLNTLADDESEGIVALEQIEARLEANERNNCEVEGEHMGCDEENNIGGEGHIGIDLNALPNVEANERNNIEVERDDMECDEENDSDDEADEDYVPELEDHNDEQHEVEEEAEASAAAGPKHRRRRRIVDMYGLDIFKAGLAVQPLNPYFVTAIAVQRKHELYIPMDLVKRVHVDFPSEIWLVDQNGEKFKVKRSVWKNGRTYYINGWSKFCKSNDVTENDRCIMEFVPLTVEDNEPKINVTIIRAGDLQRLNV